jgi:hypothetical protein
MVDMSKFIVAKSDQLNADDLLGGPRVITITGVRGTDASDQPVAVNYEGDAGKPYKPCKSMRRVMVFCWGKDAHAYAGKSMELYCDPEVSFGGMKVGGIRISRMSHIGGPKQMALTATRGKKGLYKVEPLTDAPQQQQQTSQQPEGDGLNEANARMTQAAGEGTSALETAWKAKGMEPYREALRPRLDAWKATAAEADFRQPSAPQPASEGSYDGA